ASPCAARVRESWRLRDARGPPPSPAAPWPQTCTLPAGSAAACVTRTCRRCASHAHPAATRQSPTMYQAMAVLLSVSLYNQVAMNGVVPPTSVVGSAYASDAPV